jgi:WD40 repeat protein
MASLSLRSEIDVSESGVVRDLAFSPDGELLACAVEDTVLLLSVPEMKVVRTLKAGTSQVVPCGPLRCVAFTPDGAGVAAGSAREESVDVEESVFLWNVKTGRLMRTFSHHDKTARSLDGFGISSLGITPDGRLLITGCANKTVGVWDVASGRKLRLLRGHARPVTQVAVSGDGRWIAAGDQKRDVRVWNSKTWKETRLLRAREDWVGALTFASDALLAGGDASGIFQIWDLESGNTLEMHQVSGAISSIACSPIDPVSAVTTDAGLLSFWKQGSATPLLMSKVSDKVLHVAFAPDGRLLATGGSQSVKLFDFDPTARPAARKPSGGKTAAGKGRKEPSAAPRKKPRASAASSST